MSHHVTVDVLDLQRGTLQRVAFQVAPGIVWSAGTWRDGVTCPHDPEGLGFDVIAYALNEGPARDGLLNDECGGAPSHAWRAVDVAALGEGLAWLPSEPAALQAFESHKGA
jgi:hypothetical protein